MTRFGYAVYFFTHCYWDISYLVFTKTQKDRTKKIQSA